MIVLRRIKEALIKKLNFRKNRGAIMSFRNHKLMYE
jgi:hypothetical protein